jgi:NitT/TauT family transport system permease protein
MSEQLEVRASLDRVRIGPLAPKGGLGGGLGLISVGGVLLLWEAIGSCGLVAPLFLPPLSSVLLDGFIMISSGELWAHLWASLWRILWGFFLGAGSGIFLGLCMGISRVVDGLGHPLVAASYPIPKIALLPLFILWFGLGESSKVAVIGLGVFFPVLVNTRAGVKDVSPLLIQAAVSLGSSRARIARKVLFPASLPTIFAGLKLGAGAALLLLVTAEMIAADKGIGFMILSAANLMQTTRLLFGVLLLAALGLFSNWILVRLEQRLIPWKP